MLYPHIHVDLSDNDETSQAISSDEGAKWMLCIGRGGPQETGHCTKLVGGEPPLIMGGACVGFTALRRDSLMISVWLELRSEVSELPWDHPVSFRSPPSLENNGGTARSSMEIFDFGRFPPAGQGTIDQDGSMSLSLPLERGLATMEGVRRTEPFSDLRRRAQELASKNAANWETVLDQMLAHLGDSLLCVSEPSRRVTETARILVLGDSHSRLFLCSHGSSRYSSDACGLSNYHVCTSTGATAHGILNKNSITAAWSLFGDCLQRFHGADRPQMVAIMLGEVDIRSVAEFRFKSKGISMLDQISTSIKNLFTYVHDVLGPNGFTLPQVIIHGAPPICEESGIYNASGASNHAAWRLNNALKERCRVEGCSFVNPWDELFDFESGKVDPYFHTFPNDLHCNPMRTHYFWHRAIAEHATGVSWCDV